MKLEEAKAIMRERIIVDRQMRDGDIDSDYSIWAEEQSRAMETVLEKLEELEGGNSDGIDKDIQEMEDKHTTK